MDRKRIRELIFEFDNAEDDNTGRREEKNILVAFISDIQARVENLEKLVLVNDGTGKLDAYFQLEEDAERRGNSALAREIHLKLKALGYFNNKQSTTKSPADLQYEEELKGYREIMNRIAVLRKSAEDAGDMKDYKLAMKTYKEIKSLYKLAHKELHKK